MRRTSILLIIVVLVASMAACSSGGSDAKAKAKAKAKDKAKSTTTTTSRGKKSGGTTTTIDPGIRATPSDYVSAFTIALSTGEEAKGNLVLSKPAARCIARRWVKTLTLTTLLNSKSALSDLSKPGFDVTSINITPAKATAMVDAFTACKQDLPAIFLASLAWSITPEQEKCRDENTDPQLVRTMLIKTLGNFGDSTEYAKLAEVWKATCQIGA